MLWPACLKTTEIAPRSSRNALGLDAGVPAPFSLVVLALLAVMIKAPGTRWPRLSAAATMVVLGLGLPLGQVLFFGRTSYARPADVIVVFGARCYSDGRPSQSLADRVRTGCRLYRRAGRTAYTVPADEAYTVRQTPYLVAREVAGFWRYFLRTLA